MMVLVLILKRHARITWGLQQGIIFFGHYQACVFVRLTLS